MLEEFRYKGYRRLLQRIRATHENLTFGDFPCPAPPPRYFILRHDVDYSPGAALRMARLKAEMGFRATYFLLFTVAYYNLLSEEHCGVPRDLVTLGHDVGLRYDLQVFSRMGAGVVERAIEFQARLLEETAGRRARLERVVEEAVRSLRDRTACQKQIWTVFLAARESRSPGEAGGSGGAP